MKISINKSKKDKRVSKSNPDYMMVNLTPKEALAIASSLVQQVATNNPNASRPEIIVGEGDFIGYFSITVMHSDTCIQCGYTVPETGFKLIEGGLLCPNHDTPRERDEKERALKKSDKQTI